MRRGGSDACIDSIACPQGISADARVAIQDDAVAQYYALLTFDVTTFGVGLRQPIVEAQLSI